MKKVRYAMGAVALAPVVGLVQPGPALAAPGKSAGGPASGKTAARSKTVFLYNSVSPDVACTGQVVASATNPSRFFERFWYTNHGTSTCIGTVEPAPPYSVSQPHWRIRVWHGTTKEYSTTVGGSLPAIGIHRNFPNQPKVCAQFFDFRGPLGSPVCKTVP